MKLKLALLSVAGIIAMTASSADAALIAYWNFNTLSITTAGAPGTGTIPASIAADSGTGTIDLSTFTGLIDDFAGTTLNALNGDPAEESLSLVSNAGNGSSISFTFSTLGLEGIVLTADVRGTGTGFTTGVWSYTTNGTDYTPISGNNIATTSTTFATLTADFTSVTGMDNMASVTLVYTVSGATSASGNNRLDNVQINSIPEPAAALLGALGLLGLLRRGRR